MVQVCIIVGRFSLNFGLTSYSKGFYTDTVFSSVPVRNVYFYRRLNLIHVVDPKPNKRANPHKNIKTVVGVVFQVPTVVLRPRFGTLIQTVVVT